MFRELGIALDELIWDIKQFLRKYYQKTPPYKIYAYLFIRNKINQGIYIKRIELFEGMLYKKHYEKLIKINEERWNR